MHRRVVIVLILIGLVGVLLFFTNIQPEKNQTQNPLSKVLQTTPQSPDLLTIAAMRASQYPGSKMKIEETLTDGVNYHQYIVSYLSGPLHSKFDKTLPS